MVDNERLKSAQKTAVNMLLKVPGVRSVAIGPKYSNGQAVGEMAIVIGVERKRAASEIPTSEMIPATIDGIKTDVVEQLEKVLIQCTNPVEDTTRYRPILGGTQLEIGLGNGLVKHGTLGFLAFTTGAIPNVDQDLIVGVTCQHVVADAHGVTFMGKEVGQSTLADCSVCSPCCIDIIGKVLYAVFTAPDGSWVDAALIDLTSGLEYYNDVQEIGAVTDFHAIQPSDLRLSPPHYPVKKRGRTTGLTTGDVLKLSSTSIVNGVSVIDNEIQVQPDPTTATWCKCGKVANLLAFACEGDSGSALMNGNDEVVGLVRARDNNGNGYAVAIDTVMNAMGILIGTASEEGDKRVVPPHPNATPAALGTSGAPALAFGQQTILDRAQQEILATASGKRYAELVAKHQIEIRNLINRNKRVATVWHRNNGPTILNHAMLALGDSTKALPVDINGLPLTDSIARIVKAVEKHSSSQLRADIAQYGPALTELSGLTYPKLLDRLRDVHVE